MIRGAQIAWLIAGTLIGAGLMLMSYGAWWSLVPAAGCLVAAVTWGRDGWRNASAGFFAATAIPAAVLLWAAATEHGCPAPDAAVILKPGKPAVDCGGVVAGYMSAAVMFSILAGAALWIPRVLARQDAASGSEDEASTSGTDPAPAEGGQGTL